MNSKNYTYIRILLNGSCVTDEILNRIFCLENHEVTTTQWVFLDDTKAEEIKNWIKDTDSRVRAEKLKAKLKVRYWRKALENSKGVGQSS